ncbi:M42 family metallopeptidase [Paenibacillus sediminis]|uniref:Endoglucanase n=1 Tax=Paenibacillus sediminis TaxID=664909 RepID=A0ABS4GYE4_9BACL|nr:M42 family metallopeptidase [Paenibacillus sediminis]MBP1935279.1 endoglucanase [Paenibacillus sediminis]
MDQLTQMMKQLSEADGVPGFEKEVRFQMEKWLKPVSEEMMKDRLGGVVGRKTGSTDGPRILLTGHLDEVGFMVSHITPKGFLRFHQLGGWWPHSLLSQRVKIKSQKGDVIGIIGSKPPHVITSEERNKVLQLKDMYIDIGASSAEEVQEMGIYPGDPIVPIADFFTMKEDSLWVGKALDNRAGCALAIEVMNRLHNETHPNVVFSGATVQEEVGIRGAGTLAELVKPDIAIAVDVGIAMDTPGLESGDTACEMGKGPMIVLYDATMVPHVGLRKLIFDAAKELQIPIQTTIIQGGGTDAGKFHTHGIGCPSIALGFATRYIHTHSAIMSRKDFEETVTLVTEVIKRLDWDQVNQFLQ